MSPYRQRVMTQLGIDRMSQGHAGTVRQSQITCDTSDRQAIGKGGSHASSLIHKI